MKMLEEHDAEVAQLKAALREGDATGDAATVKIQGLQT